jgi:hypothetical protein
MAVSLAARVARMTNPQPGGAVRGRPDYHTEPSTGYVQWPKLSPAQREFAAKLFGGTATWDDARYMVTLNSQVEFRLQGTEKQVVWAEQLRAGMTCVIEDWIGDMMAEQAATDRRILLALIRLLHWMQKQTDATWFIDNRGPLHGKGSTPRVAFMAVTLLLRRMGIDCDAPHQEED